MNNPNNNPNGEQKPFKVNMDDDGFLNFDDLNAIDSTPVPPVKKKFEVHIEDDTLPPVYDDHTPKYKGEVYFSNRKPLRKSSSPAQAQNRTAVSKNKNNIAKKAFSSATALFWVVVIIFTTVKLVVYFGKRRKIGRAHV